MVEQLSRFLTQILLGAFSIFLFHKHTTKIRTIIGEQFAKFPNVLLYPFNVLFQHNYLHSRLLKAIDHPGNGVEKVPIYN